MPNTKSAEKRLRQNEDRRARNRAAKSFLRKRTRIVREAVAAGDLTAAENELKVTAKHFDRAGARGIIHPNKAGRLKSRLQSLIKKAKSGQAAAGR